MRLILAFLFVISLSGCRFALKEFDSHIGEITTEIEK